MTSDKDYREQLRREVEREVAGWLETQEEAARARGFDEMAAAFCAAKVAVVLSTYRPEKKETKDV